MQFKGKTFNSEYKYLEDDLPSTDIDGVDWDKCDGCGNCYHLVCWEKQVGQEISWNNWPHCSK